MISSPPRNIEIFDQITAYILIKLYGSFPIPQNLYLEDIYNEAIQGCTDANEAFEIYTSYITSTISFLSDEKFIQHDQNTNLMPSDLQYFGARLTLKGLTLLGTVPKTINDIPQSSFIELLKSSFNTGTKSALSDIVKSFLMYAAKNISDSITT